MKEKGDLTRLAAAVAARQDDDLARHRVVEAAGERLFARRRPVVRSRRPAALVATIAAAAAVLFFLLRPAPKATALSFVVDGVAGTPGAWIGAASTTALPVRFSNGASVVLAPQSRARIATLSARGAAVQLESGRLTVAVPHEAGTDWRFDAGPYAVKVIGTRFDVSWDAIAETFEIQLAEGSVEVRGPRIEGVRRVAMGESLRLSAPKLELPVVSSAAPLPPPDLPEPSAVPMHRIAPASPDWASLVRDGSYREAFALADKRGFDAEVARANPSDLLLLGDASRYTGNPTRARQCYVAVRTKFAGSLDSSRASFRLGVLDFPATSSIALFEQFLREQPGDPLASEALGRILEIDDKAGDVDAARAVSERYLAKYPDGAHARLAHGILGR